MSVQLSRIRGGVTQSVRHDSSIGHVTGGALYSDDVPSVPGSLHAALVLSVHAHARIKHIDLSSARAADGVVSIVTNKDIPGTNDIAPLFKNEPLLTGDLVEHEGQIIAAVAATTLEQARAAAALIRIDYEPLTPVLSVDEAVEKQLFVAPVQKIERGDIELAMKSSSCRLDGELRCGGQDHFYLECQIAIATPGEGPALHILCSTQHPTEVQHGVAHVLGIPFNMVSVEVRRMGGAFGGKESQATIIAGIAALLAWKSRRPVKLRLPRDDDMRATGKRHPFLIRYEVGFDDNGAINALDLMLAANGGHVADHTPAVLMRALCHADNCYWIPALRFRGLACKTNTVSNTAFRGYGGPQGMFAIETILDIVARHLGKPLDDVRERNFYGTKCNNTTPYGMIVEDNMTRQVIDGLDDAVDFATWRNSVAAFNRSSMIVKKGFATVPVKFGIAFSRPALNQAGALVNVYTDGSVTLNHGGTEMGQGLFIKVAQVVAQTFQIDIENIRITATTTDKIPNTSPTAASSGSDLNGMAAKIAAERIRNRMSNVAAEHFNAAENEVSFSANRVYAGNHSMSFAELAALSWEKRISLSSTGFYRTPKLHWDPQTNSGRPYHYFTYGVAAAEVAIDTLTGELRVMRVELLQDCGDSLNPAIDLGQIEGAFTQGMGWLTMEELFWDAAGKLRTHGPSTYKIPGSRDIPPVFNARILQNSPNKEDAIFRSKAVGEPPLMLALSVWLAVRDAISSLSNYELSPNIDAPTTPSRILAAVANMVGRANCSSGV